MDPEGGPVRLERWPANQKVNRGSPPAHRSGTQHFFAFPETFPGKTEAGCLVLPSVSLEFPLGIDLAQPSKEFSLLRRDKKNTPPTLISREPPRRRDGAQARFRGLVALRPVQRYAATPNQEQKARRRRAPVEEEFKQKNSLSQQTGSTQVRTGAC